MATKRKFKRDYIILEAKDMNFRYKERVLPKAFAKVEINEEKAVVALYVENLKCVKDGYKVVAIQSDYETLDLGNVVLSEQGKGEFVFDLERNDIEIKGIALLHEKQVPLIGFKGNKIENYEEILFAGQDEYEEEFDDELDDLEDTEDIYIDTEDDDDEYEYEEIEYIEVDGYRIDENKRRVSFGSQEIDLTTKEYELLIYFVKNKGIAISREQVLTKVWDENYFGSDRVVDDTLRRLRKKMPDLNIKTMYGYGYRLD